MLTCRVCCPGGCDGRRRTSFRGRAPGNVLCPMPCWGEAVTLTQALCRGKEMWFNGYREQNMLVVFITLWCAVSYYAKVRYARGLGNS